MKNKNFKNVILGLCGVAAMGLGVSSASALVLDGSGNVSDWGVTPFSNSIPLDVAGVNGNNYSPINYPHGVGFNPSPGGVTGEKFDLEGLYARRDGNQLQVLLIASNYLQATAGSHTYNLGDLMIDVDNNGSFDMGVVTQSGNAGLVAGDVYGNATTRNIQHIPGSYYNYNNVTSQIGAWAITGGDILGSATVVNTTFSYAGEANTSLTQWNFMLDEELKYHDIYMQFAWGCGNDMIGVNIEGMTRPQGNPDPKTPATPEPATAVLGLLSLGGLAAASRRRRGK